MISGDARSTVHSSVPKWGSKVPSIASGLSTTDTTRSQKQNFKNTLFVERPLAQKLSFKLKQSTDFDDIDRHFSLDESCLQSSKSRRLSDHGINNHPDSKKLRNSSLLAGLDIAIVNTQKQLSQQQRSTPKPQFNSFSSNKYPTPREFTTNPLEETFKDGGNQNKSIFGQQQRNISFGFSSQTNLTQKKDHINANPSGSQILEINLKPNGLDHHLQILAGSMIESSGHQHYNIGSSAVANSHGNSEGQSQSAGDNIQPTGISRRKFVEFALILFFGAIVIQLCSCSYGNQYIFTFVNSALFGLIYAQLLLQLIMKHPFFKITNEIALDYFSIPNYAYNGFIFSISILFGYSFRKNQSDFQLNLFNLLPIISIIGFLIFGACAFVKQPRYFKRLKLTYGRNFERKLTLSQSKSMRKGMTQHNLPTNLNNFLPDEQGPSISSFKFYCSLVLCLCLLHAQVYYALNQEKFWIKQIQENQNYIYLIMFVFLLIGEVIAAILYNLDTWLELELKYELEFIRIIFTVSLYRIFFLMFPSIIQGGGAILVKVIYKFLMYFIYPTQYEFLKTKFRTVFRYFKTMKPTASFKDQQRRLFQKKWGILQYSDIISLPIFLIGVLIFSQLKDTENDYSRLNSSDTVCIIILCGAELAIEVLTTFVLTHYLSKNQRFNGLTIRMIINEIKVFLVESKHIPLLAFYAVQTAISISISNNHVSFSNILTKSTTE